MYFLTSLKNPVLQFAKRGLIENKSQEVRDNLTPS